MMMEKMTMNDFKNELEQEVEFINDLISRYLPDETGLDKKIREAMNYSVNAGEIGRAHV